MTTVVTGFHPEGYRLYGKSFLESFHAFWPKSVGLITFSEETIPTPRGDCLDVLSCRGLEQFLDRHRDNPEYCGRAPNERWKEKERLAGYSFRFDAVKFCKQLFYPETAAEDLPDGEILAWLDGDVLTFADVPEGFLEDLIGDADLVYLGRGGKHSEIGFWAVRRSPNTRAFLTALADIYRTGKVFGLAEWHSAFVFDHVRGLAEQGHLRSRNLTPHGRGHVWFQSPLGQYTDHLKGKRKLAGRSKERRA